MNYATIKKPRNDITNQVFGKLTILEYIGCDGKNSLWKAKCECGNYTIAKQTMLLRGKKKSCGCLPQYGKKKGVCGVGINDMPVGYGKHSILTKAIYDLWVSIISRCYKRVKKTKSYADCTVCERWKRLSNFAEDIKHLNGYVEWEKQHISSNKISVKDKYVIDKDCINYNARIYSPETCQFIKWSDNQNEMLTRKNAFKTENKSRLNRSREIGVKISKFGVTANFSSIALAAKFLNVEYRMLYARIARGKLECNGYSISVNRNEGVI